MPTSSLLRTALFVPASRAERIPKALASGADAVIVDLEDAVEHLAKDSARQALCDFLGTQPQSRVWVRINDASTPWHDDDLRACRGRSNVAAIMLPKAESMAHVRHASQTGIPIVPIIETARGVLNVGEIAATPGIARLSFGGLDLGADLNLVPDSPGETVLLNHARAQVLLHSRGAGLAPPLDGVYPDIQDAVGLRVAASRARDMGFAGMMCIHPSQIGVVHEAYQPAQADVDWARRVVQAYRDSNTGAFRLDGKMVDAPVVARARQVLERAGELGA
ncbi:citrate lyase subunit beta [Bordetella ansorpii]|uniref:Citrate lyase subunit beta n=1 Tax=Bordetella ansorpii TaxID=288768 RepID=A0A157S5Y9_9BORD|nr:citrate lyase subunit beta [Bordetella ansorpii]